MATVSNISLNQDKTQSPQSSTCHVCSNKLGRKAERIDVNADNSCCSSRKITILNTILAIIGVAAILLTPVLCFLLAKTSILPSITLGFGSLTFLTAFFCRLWNMSETNTSTPHTSSEQPHNTSTPHTSFRKPQEPEYIVEKAPLTFVRSEKPTNLKISILFDAKYKPVDPIVPKPTEIVTESTTSKYTWNVLTHADGTMTSSSMDGLRKRINMIWWEAIRKELPTRLDEKQAVCVKRSEMKEFLGKSLAKLGLKDRELVAFTQYWNEQFKANDASKNTPYVLIQLINPQETNKFLPTMTVEGESAESFTVNRIYFRFEPISKPDRGVEAESYLANLKPLDLGLNAVIDLGGEVAKSPEVQSSEETESSTFSNEAFINEYLYVG
jgi:hypothetical protein